MNRKIYSSIAVIYLTSLASCSQGPERANDASQVQENQAGNSENSAADRTAKDIPDFEVCDEEGNRYPSEADAEAAGLSRAQYGATYCEM